MRAGHEQERLGLRVVGVVEVVLAVVAGDGVGLDVDLVGRVTGAIVDPPVVAVAFGEGQVAILQGILIMAGSALIFGVNWGNPIAAGVLMIAFAFVASSAGLLMGATARTPQQSLAFGLLLSLGLAALGGTMMPLDLFPPTMRAVAHLTPHAWAVDGFAELVRHGGGLFDILPQLGVLLATAAALMTLASWRLRRSITG